MKGNVDVKTTPTTGFLTLYGKTSVRWYVNKDIEEINDLRAELGHEPTPILETPVPPAHRLKSQPVGYLPPRNIDGLINYDLFANQDSCFECTVNLTMLNRNTTWWFTSCKSWQAPMIPDGPTYAETSSYTCMADSCEKTAVEFRYQVYATGYDNTGTTDFLLKHEIAQKIICFAMPHVICNIDPTKRPETNLDYCKDNPNFVPPELSVSPRSYRLAVTVNERSFARRQVTFTVIAVL